MSLGGQRKLLRKADLRLRWTYIQSCRKCCAQMKFGERHFDRDKSAINMYYSVFYIRGTSNEKLPSNIRKICIFR